MTTHDETVIIGRVGRAVELRYTKSGKAVASLSLATNRGYGDSQTTQWWNVSVWGDSAERANQFIDKGSLVRVAGEVSAEAYEKKDGTIGVSLNLNTWQWRFIGGKNEGGGVASDSGGSTAAEEEDDIPF